MFGEAEFVVEEEEGAEEVEEVGELGCPLVIGGFVGADERGV